MVSMAEILHLRQTAEHSCGNGLRNAERGVSPAIAFRFVIAQDEDSGLFFEDSSDCIETEIPKRGQFTWTIVPLDKWRRSGCGRALSLPDLPFGILRNQIVSLRGIDVISTVRDQQDANRFIADQDHLSSIRCAFGRESCSTASRQRRSLRQQALRRLE